MTGSAASELPRYVRSTKTVKKEKKGASRAFSIEHGASWTDNNLVEGPGRIRQFVVKADSDRFVTKIGIDGDVFIHDTWKNLNGFTTELDAVSSYKDGNDFVLTISDVWFKNILHTVINPLEETSFPILYLEVELF